MTVSCEKMAEAGAEEGWGKGHRGLREIVGIEADIQIICIGFRWREEGNRMST